jgi:archaellum component FlaC
MTIDERLERLAQRHEALTQTVELLTADNRQLT